MTTQRDHSSATASIVFPPGLADCEQSIPSCFRQRFVNWAERTALHCESGTTTYAEFDHQTSIIASALQSRLGNAEQKRVALILEEHTRQIMSIFAVLRSGHVFVPLEAMHPPAHLSLILEDVDPSLLLCESSTESLAQTLAASRCSVLNVDELKQSDETSFPEPELNADSLAYILYTSGSTGKPKGVVQNHRNVLHNAMKHIDALMIRPDDRHSLLSSYCFAASMSDIFPTLLSGATLMPCSLRTHGFAGLVEWLRDFQITIYHSVPTVYRQLVKAMSNRELLRLRLVKLGGETVRRADVESFRKLFAPHAVLVNSLGCTELNSVCQFHIDRTADALTDLVPVGRPVADVEVWTVDESGHRLENGSDGQIVIRSQYLTPGYWRRPELNAAAFQPDPKGGNEREFWTGDRGRLLPDGCLVHLGRLDSMIKIRGMRVEPEEIESALRLSSGVEEAMVTSRPNDDGEERLIAFVLTSSPARTPTELKQELASRLPASLIASEITILKEFPRLSNGKIDRAALLARNDADNEKPDPPYTDTPLLRTIIDCWKSVLGNAPSDPSDNFFDSGGDSLSWLKLIFRLERATGQRLWPGNLLLRPTAHGLAAAIAGIGLNRAHPAIVPLRTEGSKPPLFCLPQAATTLVPMRELVRALPADQPFYGVQPPGLLPHETPLETVPDLAAHMIHAIRSIQPRGPYYLGGICFGGVVAFEVARQLQTAGEQIGCLLLIDAFPPTATDTWHKPLDVGERSVWRQFRNAKSWPARRQKLRRLLLLLSWRFTHHGRRIRSVWIASERARRKYVAEMYHGRITLFSSEERDAKQVTARWQKLTSEKITAHVVQGSMHANLLRPPMVERLAEELKRVLESSQAAQQGAHCTVRVDSAEYCAEKPRDRMR